MTAIRSPVTGWLSNGFAVADSSYASTGWAIQQALPDQVATLDVFDQTYRTPDQTIAWGHSPAFVRYRPAPYLRPFDLPSQ